MAVGIFSMVTAEQLPVGLLTPISEQLGTSAGRTGLLVTVPGIVAAIAAPVIPVAVGKLDRRVLLVSLMALMTLASLVSVLTPDFTVLLAARVLVALVVLLPALPAGEPVRPRQLARQLRHGAVVAGAVATFLLVTGHFAAYTFVSPVLQHLSSVHTGLTGVLLLGYGLAGIVGNFAAGTCAGRDVRRTVLGISLGLGAVLALFPLLGGSAIGGITLLLL
ncbi:MFS transporter [Saccharopolyspora taberi]|uniref:MFS transporter n=1 Tax=Saccharopolyspora taberi TaxID=60895 RepID=A0ABN3V589_9PSEU